MKRRTTLLLFTLFFAVSVVVALHIATPKKENHKHASFDRVFAPENLLQPLDTLNLGRHGYYFAGADPGKVFLANRDVAGYVLEINTENLRDTTYHTIKTDSLKYKAVQVRVNTPYFYLMDGMMPFIYRGNTTDWVASSYIDSTYFNLALPIADSSFALIRINNLISDLCKITKGEKKMEVFPDLLEEQYGDGIFSTDGALYYNKKTKRLVFIYYYRNQYLYMDAQFNLLNKGNTIDTISWAKIKVDRIDSESSVTMSSPPLMVNKKGSVHNDFLYNNSNILAGNEEVKSFESASVIDVYHLKDGAYQFSFYIPDHEKEKTKAFIITDDHTVLALYDHDIVRFKLPAYNEDSVNDYIMKINHSLYEYKNIVATIRGKDRKPVKE